MKKSTATKIVAGTLSTIMVIGCAPLAMAGQYTVKKGDCLSTIAPNFNTTWQVLAEMNKLANPDLIFPDQILQVPDVETAAEEVPAAEVVPSTPAETEPAEVVTTPAEEVQETAPAETETQVEAILTSLAVDDITLTGNGISPEFNADTTEYTMNVQSDIYSVKVTPAAPEGAVVTVDGTEVAAGESAIVKLDDSYEAYDSELVKEIPVVVTAGDQSKTYTVTVTRACDNDTYALFSMNTYTDEETGVEMPYALYVPSNYDETKEYPIIFALHGSGQRSQTPDMVLKRYQMATVWAKDSEAGKNECIVLAPQCATQDENENWTSLMEYRNGTAENAFALSKYSVAAYNLLEKVMGEYSVDTNRVYMTGLSAGGFATYALAIEHPDTFAALVVDAGGADPAKVEALRGIPMWIFHAADDPTVAPDEFLYPTLEALDAAGIEYKSTIYPEGAIFAPSAHFSWDACYANQEMRDWVFAQTK